MTSSLYECEVMHCRTKPKRHRFVHKVFMFYLDLDDLSGVQERVRIFSYNKPNIYSLRDCDHFELTNRSLKDKVLDFLRQKNFTKPFNKIFLLTNVRTFGHIFNPVCFYFCFNNDEPVCVIPEISNTFREVKPFLLSDDAFNSGKFQDKQDKYFYISPFTDLDITMDFRLKLPGDRLEILIDDIQDNEKFLYTSLIGQRKELSTRNLVGYTLRFPFVTLKVIGLIHFHAFLLWLKGVKHHAKEANPDLQKAVLRPWSKDEPRPKNN